MNRLIDKNPFLIYLVIVSVGLIAHYASIAWLEELYSALDVSAAVALAIFAFWGYLKYIRQEESVRIVFEVNGKYIDTGLSLLRKDCTRSEVMGLLGMIQKDPKTRFEIAAMKKIAFLDTLAKIQRGKEKELHITVTEDELRQFEIKEGQEDGKSFN